MLRMKNLISQLNMASEAYYNGESIMDDVHYDRLYNTLKELETQTGIVYANSPTQTVGAPVLDELAKIQIKEQPMLSLDKCHSAEEVVQFANNHTMVAMLKCDGLSIRLTYENGDLIAANTRGNGEIGVDITPHAAQFRNIPLHIPTTGIVVIDGEAVIKWNDFVIINQNGEFKNPRNTAAGTLNSLDTKVVKDRRLSFIAWDFIKGCDSPTMSGRLEKLKELGFENTYFSVLSECNVDNVNELNDLMTYDSNIPWDGVVWKYNDLAYGESLGRTAHHFNWAIAWKPEIEIFETKLLDIDWTMGRTGVLTPVAVFEPVDDGESVITRASLHNLSIMEEILKVPYVGQKLEIYKANMIIPQVLSADKDGFTIYATDKAGNKLIEWRKE